jgi:hypothetical protein
MLLRESDELGISQGEETITDNNLLRIRRSQLPGISVWKCPKPLERFTGLDWEWVIGSDYHGWLRYAVQAKKLTVSNKRYISLNHRVNVNGSKIAQAAILEAYAASNQAIPLYCFYNYVYGLFRLSCG